MAKFLWYDIAVWLVRIFCAAWKNLAIQKWVTRTRHEFDQLDHNAMSIFFDNKRPEYVFLAAEKLIVFLPAILTMKIYYQ